MLTWTSYRKREKACWFLGPLIGALLGYTTFYNFTLSSQKSQYETILAVMFATGAFVILLSFASCLLVQMQHSALYGLCLSVSIYGAFAIPWLLDNGSFEWMFLLWGCSGSIIYPACKLLTRTLGIHQKIDPRCCQHCGYLLAGLCTHRCPECGTEFDPELLKKLQIEEPKEVNSG
ncbi:MAG: hypothetical protein HJJLKODD_00797 [Phycisphaerae bacterium]|nr:hypothetical protein [Phycisphaerae bacterium]